MNAPEPVTYQINDVIPASRYNENKDTRTDVEGLLVEKAVHCGALSKLANNTMQRNQAQLDAYNWKNKYYDLQKKFIQTLGRVPNSANEALEHAYANHLHIVCPSTVRGHLSKIRLHRTKGGKEYLAHFTQNDVFIKKCTKKDETPIPYDDFLDYNKFKTTLDNYRNNRTTGYKTLEDLFDFTTPPEPEGAPEPTDDEMLAVLLATEASL